MKQDRDEKQTGMPDARTELPLGCSGQDLVMAGYMGLDGSAALIGLERERLEKQLPEELLDKTKEYLMRMGQSREQLTDAVLKTMGASAWYPLEEGGVLNGLWYMAHQWKVGFTLQLKDLPVRQETIEICEILGVNPYYLRSKNCLLLAADHGGRLCQKLAGQGMAASVIGVLDDTNDRILLHDDTVSYLNRPREDELARFMREKAGEPERRNARKNI